MDIKAIKVYKICKYLPSYTIYAAWFIIIKQIINFMILFHIFVTYTNTNVLRQTKKGEYKHKYIQLKKGRIWIKMYIGWQKSKY